MDLEKAVQELLDRQRIQDTLYRYASTIDDRNLEELRELFVDDAVGTYGDGDPIHGADAIVAWIDQMTVGCAWQHHKLTVYHVDIGVDGDGDEARALTYHTSHQTTKADPDVVTVIVARYRDVLRRVGDSWKIADKVFEIGWTEQRSRPVPAELG